MVWAQCIFENLQRFCTTPSKEHTPGMVNEGRSDAYKLSSGTNENNAAKVDTGTPGVRP
jgi:hypothetical protein